MVVGNVGVCELKTPTQLSLPGKNVIDDEIKNALG